MSYALRTAVQPHERFGAGYVSWLRNDEDIQAGMWACTPADQPDVYEATFELNETILVLEGRVRVEILGGETYELGPGDMASFVAGTVGRWTILERILHLLTVGATVTDADRCSPG
jgi:uncharacterized cupin superfamily protein